MRKQVVFKMPLDLFRLAKVRAAMRDQTMTDYIISLITKDLQTESKS